VIECKIWIENNRLYIIHPFDSFLNEKYRQFYFTWNNIAKQREKDLKKVDLRSIAFIKSMIIDSKKYKFNVDPKVLEFIKEKMGGEDESLGPGFGEIEKAKPMNENIDFSFMKVGLFDYQKYGVAFINSVNGIAMLGDQMGVGKSGQVISYSTLNKLYTVIVCPSSLKYKWKSEVEKFTGCSAVVLSEYDPEKLDPKSKLADFVIINYEQLIKYEKYLSKAKFDLAALDESHYILNLKAQRTKTVFKLFKKISKRICVSGTPIKNRPIDFYPQLKFLRPDIFGNKMDYGIRYCNAKETPFGWDLKGSSHLDELHKRISPFYIRRTKDEVLKDLPEKTVSLMEMEMNDKERLEYDDLTNEFYEVLKNKKNDPMDVSDLGKMIKMRQFCSKSKLNRIVEFVEQFLESSDDRKIVIFSQFIETQKKLKEAFKGRSVSLMGEDSSIKRNEAVTQFQNDPKVRIFVGSSIAAGVGLDLYAADTVIFADLMWSPSDHQQAEDRCILEGQYVLTKKGNKKIENVKIGDLVLTHKGNFKPVLDTWNKEHRGLFTKISYVRYNQPLVTTHDHKVFAFIKNTQQMEWIEAYKLMPGDALVTPRIKLPEDPLLEIDVDKEFHIDKTFKNNFGVDQVNGRLKSIPDKIKLTPIFLEFLGWYVAEGFASNLEGKEGFISLSGHEKEKPILERFGDHLKELFDVNYTIYTRDGSKGIELRSYSKVLANFMKSIFEHRSDNKSLPDFFFSLNVDQVRSFLTFYFKWDGYFRKNQQTWSTVSEKLSGQITLLLLALGENPTQSLSFMKKLNHHDIWTRTFTDKGTASNKMLNLKNKDYSINLIKEVTNFKDKKRVYDLTVEDDSSFVVGGATVHNCHRIGQKNAVSIYYFTFKNSIESMLWSVVGKKLSIINEVLEGKKDVKNSFNAERLVFNKFLTEFRKDILQK